MKIHRRTMNTFDSGLISEKYDHVISVTIYGKIHQRFVCMCLDV